MFIFDTHTHFFSRAFYVFQAQQARQPDIPKLLDKMARNGIEVPGEDHRAHRQRIIATLDANHVDRAVTFASVPPEMEIVGQAALDSGGRLVPYAIVNPRVPETLEMLARLQPKHNFRGMLLFPAMHDYAIGSDVAVPALDFAAANRMVTFVHCGLLKVPIRSLLGLEPEFPLEHAHPVDVARVAQARPGQVFVLPHFGAGFFDEFLRAGAGCPNIYADTAGSNAWGMFHAPELELADMFKGAVEHFGIEQILYGSDSAGFPRGYRRDVMDAQLAAMASIGLSDDQRAAIMGGNLARLLGDA